MANVMNGARELPEGWRWAKLGDVCNAIRGVTFPSSEAKQEPFESSIACLTTRGVQDKTDWSSCRYIPQRYVQRRNQIVQAGDVLVSTANSKALVGKSCLIDDDPIDATFGAFVTVLRPKHTIISSLLASWMRTTDARNYFFVKSSHTTNISNLRVSDLLALEIPLPPLPEQRRIAVVLNEHMTAVEKARVAAQARLEAAQALPAALLREVFESEEAKGWERRKLGDVLMDIQAGKSLSCEERPANDSEWGVLKVSAVSWGKFQPNENKVLPSDYKPPIAFEVQTEDLLISRANTIELVGAVVLVRETRPRLMLSDKTLRIVTKEQKVLKNYLEIALRERVAREFIQANATGTSSSMKNISQDTIRNIPTVLPPIHIQKSVVAKMVEQLKDVEQIQPAIQSQLAAIEALPGSLLCQAFTGEL